MSFNSYSFLFLFFPVFFLVYRRIDVRLCAPLLCVGSLTFYAVGVWKTPWQMIPLAAITLLCVLGCALFQKRNRRTKGLLALWIVLTAAPLACVKISGLLPGNAMDELTREAVYSARILMKRFLGFRYEAMDPVEPDPDLDLIQGAT